MCQKWRTEDALVLAGPVPLTGVPSSAGSLPASCSAPSPSPLPAERYRVLVWGRLTLKDRIEGGAVAIAIAIAMVVVVA